MKALLANKRTYLLVMFLVFAAMALATPVKAFGAEPQSLTTSSQEAPEGYTNVADYPSFQEGSYAYAINQALATAMSSSEVVKIYIPEGTYKLEDILKIYSNTDLLLDENATLVWNCQDPNKHNLLEGRHVDPETGATCTAGENCTHGGYTQLQNITIRGGKWTSADTEGAWNTGGAIMLRHGENITLSDMEIYGFANHYINVSGTKNTKITNVTCRDAVRYTGDDKDYWGSFAKGSADRFKTIEEIHLDSCTAIGEATAYPVDNTTCQNIEVADCVFDKVFGGVGTHHEFSEHSNNVAVSGCTFNNLQGGRCVRFDSTDNVTITDNTATSGSSLVYLLDVKGDAVVENNSIDITSDPEVTIVTLSACQNVKFNGNTIGSTTLSGQFLKQNCVSLEASTTATLANNKISGADSSGVRCSGGSTATINKSDISNCRHGITLAGSSSGTIGPENTIANVGEHGVRVEEQSSATITKNTITSPGKYGIQVLNSGAVTAENNIIQNSKEYGIRVANPASATVKGNTIKSPGVDGVYVTTTNKVDVLGNTITNPKNRGIQVVNSTGKVTVGGTASSAANTISGSGQSAILVNSAPGIVIQANKVTNALQNRGTDSAAIRVSNSNNATIKSNTVENSKYQGITLTGSTGAKIDSNTVKESTDHGIFISGCTNTSITNNYSVSNIDVYNKFEYRIASGCKNTTITGNVYGPRRLYASGTHNPISIESDSASTTTQKNNRFYGKQWERLKGATAYDTMQSIVKAGWSATGGTVIVATGEGFADALAAAGIAGLEKAPILTTAKTSLSTQTKAELNRLKPKNVIIVGGRGAVSEKVENQIKALSFKPSVIRHKGAAAFNTSNAMNLAYKGQWKDTAILATSKGYADALSAAPIAYAQGYPIFLVKDKNSIGAETLATMKELGIKKVMIVGGRGAVSEDVEKKVKAQKISVDRRKGASQYDTSIEVAKWGISLGMSADKMGVATGRSYADALAGAALCGQNNAVLVLSDKTNYKTCLPIAKNNASKITMGYVYGGRGAVPDNVMTEYEKASGCVPTVKS